MKRTIRTPYFEIGTKNYIWGDKVLEYAQAADRAAEKYDIDVLFITTPVELRRVVENTKHLIVLAPYMDTLRPGRGMADILPEALKDAGAAGVGGNHCEKPMSLPQIKKTIDRAHELDMLVFACADTVAEAKAIAELHPDIINPEPSELIGGSGGAQHFPGNCAGDGELWRPCAGCVHLQYRGRVRDRPPCADAPARECDCQQRHGKSVRQ